MKADEIRKNFEGGAKLAVLTEIAAQIAELNALAHEYIVLQRELFGPTLEKEHAE